MYLLTKQNIIILTKHATDKELREGTKIESDDVLVDFETHLVFKLNNSLELKFKGEMWQDPKVRIVPKNIRKK